MLQHWNTTITLRTKPPEESPQNAIRRSCEGHQNWPENLCCHSTQTSENQEPLNALPGLSQTRWDYTSCKFIKKKKLHSLKTLRGQCNFNSKWIKLWLLFCFPPESHISCVCICVCVSFWQGRVHRQMESYVRISRPSRTNSVMHAVSEVRDGEMRCTDSEKIKKGFEDWHRVGPTNRVRRQAEN